MAQIQLQELDLLAAQWLHLRPGRWKKLLYVVVVTAVAAYVVFEVWRYLGDRRSSSMSLIVSFAIAGGLIGAVLGFLYIDLPRRTRRAFRQQRSLRDPMELTWDERGITVTWAGGNGTVAWEDFVKWKENERLILMYQSDYVFNIIPKEIFASSQDESDFRRHLPRVGANLR